MKLIRNVGSKDKTIRMGIVAASLVMAVAARNPLWLLGTLPLFSVLTGWCPLYTVFGQSTCPLQKNAELQDNTQRAI